MIARYLRCVHPTAKRATQLIKFTKVVLRLPVRRDILDDQWPLDELRVAVFEFHQRRHLADEIDRRGIERAHYIARRAVKERDVSARVVCGSRLQPGALCPYAIDV